MAQIPLAGHRIVGMIGLVERGRAGLELLVLDEIGEGRVQIDGLGDQAAVADRERCDPAVSRRVTLGMTDDDRRVMQLAVIARGDVVEVRLGERQAVTLLGRVLAGFENFERFHDPDIARRKRPVER